MPKNVVQISLHRDNLSELRGWIGAHRTDGEYGAEPECVQQFMAVTWRELEALRKAEDAELCRRSSSATPCTSTSRPCPTSFQTSAAGASPSTRPWSWPLTPWSGSGKRKRRAPHDRCMALLRALRARRAREPVPHRTVLVPGGRVTEIRVYGTPVPQGSKRAYVNHRTGRANVVEAQSARVRSWRQSVIDAAVGSGFAPGPVAVDIIFWLPRPKAHLGTGKNAGQLKPAAPSHPAVMPDLDKLTRAVLDALTDAGCWKDDGQVVSIAAEKRYAAESGTPFPGALIWIGEPR